MNTEIAMQIAGLSDYRAAEAADHKITSEERALAVEVGYEIAARHGIDLAAHVAAQHEKERVEK